MDTLNNFEFEPSIEIVGDVKDYSPSMDTATLLVCNGLSTPVELFGQVDECADCALDSLSEEPTEAGNSTALALSSIYAYRLELRHYMEEPSELPDAALLSALESCRLHVRLEEYASYVWNVGRHPNCGGLTPSNGESLCEWRQVKAGSSSLTPLVVLFVATLVWLPLLLLPARVLLQAVAIRSPAVHFKICSLTRFLLDPRKKYIEADAHESGQQRTRQRVLAVDVLRGAAVVVMIFWRYGSGSYACLDHTLWNGVHLSDCAFPAFVFVMGVSIALTNSREARRIKEVLYDPLNTYAEGMYSRNGRRKRWHLEFAALVFRFVRRTLILFVIGISLENHDFSDDPDYKSIRIFGILQRLALTYLITSLATLPVFLRYAPQYSAPSGTGAVALKAIFWDLKRFWPEWVPVMALVALQIGLEYGIDPAKWTAASVASMRGCPRGYLGPGGLHWNRSFENCTGGAHRLLDLWLLGSEHLDESPGVAMVYETPVYYEDDGLLGTCSSVFLCFLGLQAGRVLLFSGSDRERAIRWTVWATLCALLTLPLVLIPSPYQFNASLLPINFSLWTASFSLVMAAFDTALLGLLYFLVDFRPTIDQWTFWSGAPLTFLGANSILIYVAQDVFHDYLPLSALKFLPKSHWGHLTGSILAVIFWTIVAYVLYCKKLFLSI